MRYPTLARRYAMALFNSSPAEKKVSVGVELEAVGKIILEEKKIAMLFYHPLIEVENKVSLIKRLLPTIGEQTLSYLKLLFQKKRGFLFLDTVQAYHSLLQEKGILEKDAEVIAATELNDEKRNKLSHLLSGIKGEKISPKFIVDKNIIGGVRIRIGDTIYDGTIKSQLEELGRTLNAG